MGLWLQVPEVYAKVTDLLGEDCRLRVVEHCHKPALSAGSMNLDGEYVRRHDYWHETVALLTEQR